MSEQPSSNDLVGRGAREGARLFRDWFQELTQAGERGEPAAYVFVMGSMSELLRTFGIHTVFPEVNSLQTAVRRVAHEYLAEAEDYGYSPDICGYVKADVAMQLKGGQHPMGRIPRPTLAVFTNGCNTYIKWAEIWERMYHVPIFTLDVPGTRTPGRPTWPPDADFEDDRRYVEKQIRELITLCEQVTGRKFDIDKLRESMHHTNVMSAGLQRALEMNRSVPAVFNSLTDGTVFLGVNNCFRGTPEGSAYFQDLVEELEYKSAHRLGTTKNEDYRLLLVGVPCYPIFRRFGEMFSQWGGNFVISTYLWFAGGGASLGFQYDLRRPLESLAEGVLISVRHSMDAMFSQEQMLVDMVQPFHVDGLVFHAIKSCRTTSTGLADSRRWVMERADLPSLYIESDMMDKRVVSEAQLRNRIDAFFEGLATRKHAQAAANPHPAATGQHAGTPGN
ncbi:MAG: 2-hydroxyacyl-CoA dehydratase [Anaerolineales bacterium]|nr:2-hydroxyacyl-CoA dehydratase [Anaerolineales bacterium]